ncbi:hypothetical protein EC973_006628 [Apophysomyces ossiformis]|uniref:Uncharacterized protein n=1 Tax=Apophysomyces ossiformis TaxID=679940 RepID=A0A8H7BYN0_9FUNG|nr:hypothetical protein EC973_006628 [Apophysomyces ossiformis]
MRIDSPSLQESGSPKGEGRSHRLEIDNAFLTQQNAHLNKELSFTRYTINALKNIATQKENALQDTRRELDRAYFRIRMLEMALLRQQQQQQQEQFHLHQVSLQPQQQLQQPQNFFADLSGMGQPVRAEDNSGPMLINDADSSDDQELSEDDEDEETVVNGCRSSDIMSKLPLRVPVGVYEDHPVQQLTPDSPHNDHTAIMEYNV